jgi:hypothetical protein
MCYYLAPRELVLDLPKELSTSPNVSFFIEVILKVFQRLGSHTIYLLPDAA